MRDADVFGEAAVYAAAEGPAAVGVGAVVHPAVFAEEALAAICLHVHGDALAGLHLRDAAPDGLDDADHLVPYRDAGHGARDAPVLDVQVACADARERDANDGVAGLFYLRPGLVREAQLAAAVIGVSSHKLSPSKLT